jgi:membrane associated rhomboid family serine protease
MRIPRTATIAIAVLTALSWLLVEAVGATNSAALAMGFIPARLSGAEAPWAAVPALLTPLSATLVHAGFLHLVFNLLMLVLCGSAVERVLGRGGLVLLYVAGAYAGAGAQWLADPASIIPGVGASGAVSAVIGAFALSFSQAKALTRSPRVNRALNTVWLLAAWVVMQALIGWAAAVQGVLIGTFAHVGGFLAGVILQRPLLLWRYRSA